MGRYLRIYYACIKIGIQRMLAYRFDSWISTIVATGVWSFLTVFSMFALTSRTKGIFGWTANELIILAAIYNVFIGFISFFFARNFEEFSDLVNLGKLDEAILKPVDSQFYVSLRRVHITAILRTLVGIIVVAMLFNKLHASTTILHVIGFIILNVFGILLMYSMFFILNTLVIWYPRLDNLNDLFYSLRTLGRYPRNVFLQAGEVIFVLVSPFVLPMATPVRMLFGKATQYEIIELIASSIFLFIVSRLFWKFAMRSYSSASG